tara:strand:+ start:5939 stop:6136 length:198 start_codon:yes stop_codon:yes gene_type:complete
MKNGTKVGVLSDFFVGTNVHLRGTNVEIGKDLSVEEAISAANAGRLAAAIEPGPLLSKSKEKAKK